MSKYLWNEIATTRGFGAATLFAGVVAMAAAVELHEPPALPSQAAQPASLGETTLSLAKLPVLPRLSGHAVFNRGSANQHRVTQPSAQPGLVATKSADPCHSSWRPLATGPVGRLVIDTCPGQQGDLPPMPPHAVDPSHDKLPVVADLVEPIVEHPLVNLGEDGGRADTELAASIDRRVERSAPTVAPPAPPFPEFGALDWGPEPASST